MKYYKAFDKDMKCRGMQFEVGKTYEEKKAELCKSGFHACENPLDVLKYYDLIDSRFAEVELDGVSPERKEDSKVTATKIEVKAELKLKDFIEAAISFLFESNKKNPASGDSARLSASGNVAQLAASGDSAQLAASGNFAQLAASGKRSVIMIAGNSGRAKAKKGCFITLAEWGRDANGDYAPLHVVTRKVDGRHIKADTWYKLVEGKFTVAE